MEHLIAGMNTAIWEMGEAFIGLEDADLWVRPHAKLLSVGEIACHVAYWHAKAFPVDGLESPLFDERARYYDTSLNQPFHLSLGASEVYEEVKRVNEVCMAHLQSLNVDPASPHPTREGWNWGAHLTYQAFHIAYHTGQIYSARHQMGHVTVDN